MKRFLTYFLIVVVICAMCSFLILYRPKNRTLSNQNPSEETDEQNESEEPPEQEDDLELFNVSTASPNTTVTTETDEDLLPEGETVGYRFTSTNGGNFYLENRIHYSFEVGKTYKITVKLKVNEISAFYHVCDDIEGNVSYLRTGAIKPLSWGNDGFGITDEYLSSEGRIFVIEDQEEVINDIYYSFSFENITGATSRVDITFTFDIEEVTDCA